MLLAMPHIPILDQLIICAFLLITLIIGLQSGRGIKDIREYATANKMFGTGALVLTWLAHRYCRRDRPGYGWFCEDRGHYTAAYSFLWV